MKKGEQMTKHFLLGISLLPALLVMPAMAERLALESGQSANETDAVYSGYTSPYGYGGGIDNYGGTFTETNVTVQNNTAIYLGGGVNNDGEGTIIDSLIGGDTTELGNHAGGGAGIANSGTLTITGTTVQNNNATNYGGGVFNGISSLGNGVLTISNSTIKDNVAKNIGGGIFSMGSASALTGLLSITDVNFFNNSTQESVKDTAYGGALALLDAGDAIIKGSVFGGYDTTDPDNPVSLGNTSGKGGAVYIGGVTDSTHGESTVTITKDESNNKTIFDHNVANGSNGSGYGGGLVHNGYKTFLDLSDAEFTYNSATNQAGALIVTTIAGTEREDGLAATINNVLFANNTAGGQGGAVWIGSKANITNTEFRENSTTGTIEGGGAIDLGADSMTTFNNVTFTDNESSTDGGAIATRRFAIGANDSATLDITGATFTGNTATTDGGAINNYFYHSATAGHTDAVYIANSTFTSNGAANGGAIYNHKGSGDDVKVNNEYQIGSMYLADSTFTENDATTNGGAIYNEGTMQLANATFGGVDLTDPQNPVSLGNSAETGGAIYNNEGAVQMSNATFANNSASVNGGAIYNYGLYDTEQETGSYTAITSATFDGNTAVERGGAIYNYGYMTIDGATFTSNKATSNEYIPFIGGAQGGAIFNSGDFDYVDVYGILTVSNATFGDANDNTKGNTAVVGGAIANEDDCYSGEVTLNNTGFYYNKAISLNGAGDSALGGAIWNQGTMTANGNTMFKGNSATGYSPEGGAIYAFTGSLTFNDSVTFNSNIVSDVDSPNAAKGGAISVASGSVLFKKLATFTGNQTISNTEKTTVGGAINNAGTVTFEKNAVFTNNTAVDGGAIFNRGTLTLTGASSFQSNHATEGAALYNANGGTVNLTDATFRNNIATADGGAIANYSGTITLNGTNTFIGNTANNVANDILNRGTLTIASGTTTLNGGITGNGPSATLNIAEGATLNIGTASVAQNTINLNGTMLATLRGGDNAQITASTAFNGDGELKLAFDGEGLYHVFGGEVFAKENGIDLSSVVYDLTWSADGKDVTAALKSVEDLAEENHLTTETAAAVINLTNSSSNVLNDLAVTIQEKLATGTDEARQEVEQAQVAINPEKESVVQSVTSSVQNAVSSLAMSRMSMPMGGRNGGDAKMTGRGVWVNGIFNKAKQNDAFNGYTRGFAAGLDGTINNKWTIGAGYSFAHSDVDGSARDTEIESSSVFVYGQYRQKAWYVNGVANYTMADYSEQGTALGTPVTADYDVKSYGANVATGYRFAGGITPELSLRYLHIDGSDYVNSLGIKNELKESDYLTASLGTKYAFRIKVTEAFRLRPELSYAVKYDMLSDKQVANVTMPGLNSYALDGDRLSRIAGEFGIGLGARYKGLDVSLNYDIEAREDYTSQTGRLKFRYNF